MLGWEPKVPVRDGVARTIEYFRRLLAESKLATRTMAEPQAR
jgi:hypothetical protein